MSTLGDLTFQYYDGTKWVSQTELAATVTFKYLSATDAYQLGVAGSRLGFFGATPAVLPTTTGEASGFTAGGGTPVTDSSTFTGNLGSTAYRISDLVKHLKTLGLLTQ